MKKILKNNKGQSLVLTLIVIGLVLLMTITLVTGSLNFFTFTRYSMESLQALNLAEAGIDKAIASLNSTAGTYTGENDTYLGAGSFTVSITSLSGSVKQIESTGYVPNRANPKAKKTVKIQFSKGIGASFNYGIQNGEGGLIMSNNSTVNGSVYSNGNIQMSNGAKITGDAFVAGGIQPNPDQESSCTSPNCTDYVFGRDNNGTLDVAQSFKPSNDAVLNKLSLKLKKNGSPPDLTIRILADNADKPDKSNVLASGTLFASLVTNQYGYVDVYFSSPPNLTADTTYWILVDTSSNSSNYWVWEMDSLQSYTRGQAVWSSNWQANNSSWTNAGGDLLFRTYVGGVPTSVIGAPGVQIGGNAFANTLQNLTITGDAYYQYASNITAKSYHPNSIDPVAQPMPLSDGNIQDWKNTAAAAGIYTGDITNCPASLPAGKYVGSITLPNSCHVTAGAPIWITGNLTLTNNVVITLDNALASSSGVMIADNFITFNNGNQVIGNGSPGSYLIVLSEFNSRDDPTHRAAITVTNNGNTAVLYSNLGIADIANNNEFKSITAWKLVLAENVTVNYDSGMAGTFFSSGPSGAFSVIKGTYSAK